MKAIILAAGYATRLYPLTKDKPKPLLPIGGKPLLNYIMEQLERLDEVDQVSIVANHRFAEHFRVWAKGFATNKKITVLDDGSVCNDTRRGAIGGIVFAMDEMGIDEETIILCGDNLFTFNLRDYLDFYKKVGGDCVCAKEIDDREKLKSFAVAQINQNNVVVDFVEKPLVPKSNLAVFGTYIYTRDTMAMFRQYLSGGGNPDAPGNFPMWLYKQKPLYCYTFEGECFDIGTPEAYEEINKIIHKLAIPHM
ncbi:MAG: nucleotidyltransferase family protein [Defluviitaleaceae bacterium]|nr:nucleotidyltransferase family protein [Defluviitaleaceae bacterium]